MFFRYPLSLFLFITCSCVANAGDTLYYLGSYDNVKSTSSGHCYGTSVSMWKLNNKIVGLLDIHAGLCGDPPCSVIQGEKDGSNISFKTTDPVYNKHYSFTGSLLDSQLSGTLNQSTTTLNKNSIESIYDNTKSWCSAWSKVPRCSGVKHYCQ